jgi:hypothetical protein
LRFFEILIAFSVFVTSADDDEHFSSVVAGGGGGVLKALELTEDDLLLLAIDAKLFSVVMSMELFSKLVLATLDETKKSSCCFL